MHNKVVYHAMKAFSSFGLPVLRFNFRGVGLSEGEHDHGHGEQDDVRAALDWLDAEFHRPILFAGFSFGAQVGLRACCGDARVKGLIGLGLPVHAAGRDYTYGFLPQCSAPKLFISGDHDEFGPRELLTAVWQRAPEPKRLVWIAGADHFFQGSKNRPAQSSSSCRQRCARGLVRPSAEDCGEILEPFRRRRLIAVYSSYVRCSFTFSPPLPPPGGILCGTCFVSIEWRKSVPP